MAKQDETDGKKLTEESVLSGATPRFVEDGQAWLDTTTSPGTLKRWSDRYGKWVEAEKWQSAM
ncbi:hypothetical protein [Thalassospira xiamenensis]|uniref:hypothetical protein n=1 Tax=Thalassospira xiamenensis TaxID=220697 RepID=UPI000DED6757|nr:hypothetical protein [Thalassospira xiamenensis]RCK40479.1 hypothetical protein TH24_11120 [Thalassospira xiamenensis]